MQATSDAHYESWVNAAFPTGNEVTNHDGSYWEMGWGQWLIEKAEALGVTYQWHTRLEHLTTKAGKVSGVEVTNSGTNEVYHINAQKGVILCTGGYGSNLALMQQWNPEALNTVMYSDSLRDDGSGIVAGLEVGAIKDEQPASIVFNRGSVPVGTNAKHFYKILANSVMHPGYLWLGSYPFLKVNKNGERFFNESAPYQFDMNAASKQPGYLEASIWTEETMK